MKPNVYAICMAEARRALRMARVALRKPTPHRVWQAYAHMTVAQDYLARAAFERTK